MTFKESLLDFNKRGLIHAPDESDETFFLRCRKALPSHTSPVSHLAKNLFDIEPDWVWIIYDNKGLHFWEGGCTWTKQDQITVQLNRAFQKRSSYFGYSSEEVIAHELVHVVRGHFEEPIFEEILAYQTSPSFFRRFFAPVFRSAKESLIFMISLAVLSCASFFDFYQKPLYILTSLLTLGGMYRLVRAQIIFYRTKKKLQKLVGKEKSLPIMIRLTDREIIRFSKMSLNEIEAYAKKMAKITMRWTQILASYF